MATFDLGTVPTALDLAGTFVFAVSGALVAVRSRLDLFGTLVLAGATGLGGGLVRDVLLGDVPPPGLVNWKFLVVAALAGIATFLWHPVVARWENLVLTLDAAGIRAWTEWRSGVARGGPAPLQLAGDQFLADGRD